MTIPMPDCRVLYSPAAESYFTRADRRVMIGLRATLEMVGLPLPDYALRRERGRSPASRVADAFKADHPTGLPTTLALRKPNASPATVAAAKDRSAYS